MKVEIGIVISEFNEGITSKMLEIALKHAKQLKANVPCVYKVPGAFDLPIAVQHLLMKRNIDAVVVLGAVIKGETKHDELITYVMANKISELSLAYNKPVALGVIGPGATYREAKVRVPGYSKRAVDAAIRLAIQFKMGDK